MREIPQDLKESLEGPATTVARCWRLTRADGTVMGFTDHDETLRFAGTVFAAATGLAAGEAETALGLSAGTQEVEGALSADAITEEDIAAGLYDGAKVECFAVDWSDPERHMALDTGEIGEIRRAGEAFAAELRGPEAALDRERGRLYRRRCDAALGDRRCRVDLAAGGRTRTGTVTAGGETSFEAEGFGVLDAGLFLRGFVTPAGGRSAGFAREVAGIEPGSAEGRWRVSVLGAFPFALEPGEGLTLTAGCDKSFATCRDRFANGLNFRGFPHIPGLDAVLAVAKEDDLHDGSPVVP